jgi:hypothetical protein
LLVIFVKLNNKGAMLQEDEMIRCEDGHMALDCEEIEPRRSAWTWITWIVCLAAAGYFFYHLILAGYERHMAIERNERSGFTVTGPDNSSGHGYYLRRHERGK